MEALKQSESGFSQLQGSVVNGMVVLIPLVLTLIYFQPHSAPLPASLAVVIFYNARDDLELVGALFFWQLPKAQKSVWQVQKYTSLFTCPKK